MSSDQALNQNIKSNLDLSRLISIELLGSLLVSAFLIGVTYKSLAANDQQTDDKVKEVKQNQNLIRTSVANMTTDIAIIKTEQEYVKKQLQEQKADLKTIRRILEKQYDKDD